MDVALEIGANTLRLAHYQHADEFYDLCDEKGMIACNIQAVAEAFTMAQKAGVDPQLVFEAIKGGLAGSIVMNAKAPMMIASLTASVVFPVYFLLADCV